MTEFKVGDKVRITSRMSRNYDKTGVVVVVDPYRVTVRAANGEKFLTMDGNFVDEAIFTYDRRTWLTVEYENTVNLAAWCRKGAVEKTSEKTEFSFEEVARKNKEKEERIKQDRIRNNNGVTRQYNLKR